MSMVLQTEPPDRTRKERRKEGGKEAKKGQTVKIKDTKDFCGNYLGRAFETTGKKIRLDPKNMKERSQGLC